MSRFVSLEVRKSCLPHPERPVSGDLGVPSFVGVAVTGLPWYAVGMMLFSCCAALLPLHSFAADPPVRPNILWLTSEDNGPQLGCYGDEYADTPNLDALAERSLRYRMCWSNAPVCAPARTTLISGMYATSLGGENMRSAVTLPPGMELYPNVLRKAGYYCTNNSKTDYNFEGLKTKDVWDDSSKQAHWRNRPDSKQPFFAIFNYTISHESKIRNKPHTLVHDPAKAPVPSYQPDVPEVRRDWAQYYDRLTEMDAMAGKTLRQLEADGLADSTIVFYYGDHGSGMPRSKRWPFNSGLQVPFLLHVPDSFKSLAPSDYLPGGLSERLVSFVDMGPTAISLAGAEVPANMQGTPFCGPLDGEAKEYLFGYRGRMDERLDMVRSCTDGRFVYLRHFYPDRPYLKHISFMFETPTTRIWKEMFDEGLLNEIQAKVWQTKPEEELFDLQSDPDEVVNLATDPKHSEKLSELSGALKQWMIDTRDIGVLTEAEMHRRSGKQAPRTMAAMDSFPMNELVDAAWNASDCWRAFDEPALAKMSALTGQAVGGQAGSKQPDSGLQFWGCRGIHLGLQSHAGVLEEPVLNAAIAELQDHLGAESPSVRLVCAEALLQFGNADQQTAAAKELMRLVQLPEDAYYIAIAALNVIDQNDSQVRLLTGQSLADVPKKPAGAPSRGGDYVGRLLESIGERSE
uniref:sulfatase family protein n=1 Tax=Neorhodopirellula lusitana TaxID=445327 RepID=UPI00384A61F3